MQSQRDSENDTEYGEVTEESTLALVRYPSLIEDLLQHDPAGALQLAHSYADVAKKDGRPEECASSWLWLSRALSANGQLAEAREAALKASSWYGRAERPLQQAEAEAAAGKVSLALGEYDDANALLRSANRRAGRINSAAAQRVRAGALNQLAGVLHSQGDPQAALKTLHEARELWRELCDIQGQSHCLSNIGNIYTWLGDYHQAIIALTEAYELHQAHLKDARSEAFILINLARLHSLNNQLSLAIDVSTSAIRTAAELPESTIQATLHLNQGAYSLEAGQLEQAEHHLQEALSRSRALGYKAGEMNTLDSLGLLYARQADMDKAEAAYMSALALCQEVGDARVEMGTQLNLGRLYLKARPKDAEQHLQRALDLAQHSQSPREEAESHEALATLLEARGEYQGALEHLRTQRQIEHELQNTEQQRQTRNLTVQFEVERARHEAETYRLRTEVEHHARMNAEALVKARTTELAQAQQEVVTRLAMAAEYRDDTTGDHTRRVGRAASQIALALGWSASRAGTLGVAARLHDVGKIGISDLILLKPGRLTAEELQQMQLHAHIGARILSGGQSELLRFAERIAQTHHERWDGRGYPSGLSGEDIPIEGRIVAIADVFDALTHARPYKPAWTVDQAIAEIEREAGSHFDPQLVAIASGILRRSAEDELLDSATEDLSQPTFPLDSTPLTTDDTTQVLTVFEQLLVERTHELELARRAAEEAGEAMKQMALTDSLTSLANRRAFEMDLEEACSTVQGDGPLTVISLDLDGLKQLNDTWGHAHGDQLLIEFSRLMEQHFDSVGRMYRIGGDEFAVIVQHGPDPRELDELLRLVSIYITEHFPGAGVSAGSATFPLEAATPGDLLRLSDRRMYTNKLQRRQERQEQG